MYGPNYSGFAFHPKAIRMVGPVHFAVFLADRSSCAAHLAMATPLRPRRTSPSCAKPGRAAARETPHPCWVTVFPIDRPILIPLCRSSHGNSGLSHIQRSLPCAGGRDRHPTPITALRLDALALIPKPDSSEHGPARKQKRRVSREHAARFPPTTLTIKPSSSPARGTFQSRSDFVPARPPALPAPAPPSPVHNRSRRSAVPPARSAR